MATPDELKQHIIQLVNEINDEADLKQIEKSLKKLQSGEGNDWEKLKELKQERKELRDERDKIYNIISFHLGSPLRTLATLSSMVVNDSDKLDKTGVLEFISHLSSQIIRLQELMGNLIDWSSLQVRNYEVKPVSNELSKLVNQEIQLAQKQIENKRLAVEVAIDEAIKVKFDSHMLQVVLHNLISNALKFSNSEGKVVVSATEEKNGVMVSITDNGLGMSASKLKNIFNPGRKATQRGTANELGLGMGLIVTKAFLEAHEVTLEIVSERDNGSKISFLLEKA